MKHSRHRRKKHKKSQSYKQDRADKVWSPIDFFYHVNLIQNRNRMLNVDLGANFSSCKFRNSFVRAREEKKIGIMTVK